MYEVVPPIDTPKHHNDRYSLFTKVGGGTSYMYAYYLRWCHLLIPHSFIMILFVHKGR